MEENMDKEVEKIIEEKAKNVYEKYYSNNQDFPLNEKTTLINEIRFILNKTLITPERKKRLTKKYGFPFSDIFKSNSNIFFSPNFEEALKYLSPSFTLRLFEKSSLEEIDDLCNSELFSNLQTYGILQYFTIQELSNVLKDFSKFIEDNESTLIETGWPKYQFSSSAWLFYKLAPNYPIEIPAYIKDFNKLKNPSADQYFFFTNNFLNNSNKGTEYKYETVSLIENFSFKELGFMEEMRPKILNLKKKILKEMKENLFSDTTDKDLCFKNCIKILFSGISKNDLVKLFKIEKKYDQFRIYNYKVDGGIRNLVYIIVCIYQESKFGEITLTKSTYDSLLKGSKFRDQGSIKSYFQFRQFEEDNNEYERYKKIMDKLTEEHSEIYKKIDTNDKFILDILNSYGSEYLNLSLLVKSKHFSNMEHFYGVLELAEKTNSKVKIISELATSSQKRITPLELPPGTKWDRILIEFLDDDLDNYKVRISAPNNFKKIVNFREMGFENQKNGKPNKQWELLYKLAPFKGELSWTIATYRKKVDSHPLATPNAKKQIQRLSDTLKNYFSLNEAPFYDYKKLGYYKTKFFLLPEPSNRKKLL